MMNIMQIRNATQLIAYAGKRFLIDPMLAEKDAYPGFAGTHALTFVTRWSSYPSPSSACWM